MLDPYVRPYIDVPLNYMGNILASKGVNANAVTIVGFISGLVSMTFIAVEFYQTALAFLCLNRLFDGIDGAISRHGRMSDFGGFLDIVCDFIIYAGVIFAFGIADPDRLFATSFLIFSFIGPMTSFLAYAIFSTKQNRHSTRRGIKSFYYLGGLCEGTETTFFLIFICVFPDLFNPAAYIFGALCWLTTMGRIYLARQHFEDVV